MGKTKKGEKIYRIEKINGELVAIGFRVHNVKMDSNVGVDFAEVEIPLNQRNDFGMLSRQENVDYQLLTIENVYFDNINRRVTDKNIHLVWFSSEELAYAAIMEYLLS